LQKRPASLSLCYTHRPFLWAQILRPLPGTARTGGLELHQGQHDQRHGQQQGARRRQPVQAHLLLEAGLVAWITIEIAAALHYSPVSPISFGLALLGPAYTLTNLLGNLAEGEPLRQAVLEPLVVLALIWGVAFLIH